jgi:hypothetical protein
MRIPVLIEKTDQNGYRVKGGGPFARTVEGATREEALQRFRDEVNEQLAAGAEVAQVEIGTKERPWEKNRGMWAADDPVIDEWLRCIEENRRAVDADPNIL